MIFTFVNFPSCFRLVSANVKHSFLIAITTAKVERFKMQSKLVNCHLRTTAKRVVFKRSGWVRKNQRIFSPTESRCLHIFSSSSSIERERVGSGKNGWGCNSLKQCSSTLSFALWFRCNLLLFGVLKHFFLASLCSLKHTYSYIALHITIANAA